MLFQKLEKLIKLDITFQLVFKCFGSCTISSSKIRHENQLQNGVAVGRVIIKNMEVGDNEYYPPDLLWLCDVES